MCTSCFCCTEGLGLGYAHTQSQFGVLLGCSGVNGEVLRLGGDRHGGLPISTDQLNDEWSIIVYIAFSTIIHLPVRSESITFHLHLDWLSLGLLFLDIRLRHLDLSRSRFSSSSNTPLISRRITCLISASSPIVIKVPIAEMTHLHLI